MVHRRPSPNPSGTTSRSRLPAFVFSVVMSGWTQRGSPSMTSLKIVHGSASRSSFRITEIG